MKYCLNALQDDKYLQQADEIILPYRGIQMFDRLVERYPNKDIVLSISAQEANDIDWDDLKSKQILSQGHLILCLARWADMVKAKELKILFFYGFSITTFWDAKALVDLGVCYLRITAPLFFQMDLVKKLGVPIRAIANQCYTGGLEHEEMYAGTWIRPEDVELYEPYVAVIEFDISSNEEERALFRIYSEKHEWAGSMSYIFKQYPNDTTINRLLASDKVASRLTCGQRCQMPGYHCHLCATLFHMASEEFAEILKSKVNKTV